jgi:hypothetical protein
MNGHPEWKAYLIANQAEIGPHERDTLNGCVYRFIVVHREGEQAGIPVFGSFLKRFFDGAGDEVRDPDNGYVLARWSWGQAGIVAKTVFIAEKWAEEVLGDRYGGRVR